jgi:uncharacterized protein YgbK (DUF1537 family)
MTTTTKQIEIANLQARVADLEWQLQKIVAYVNETSVEEIVASGKEQFGESQGYAYAAGSLGARLKWVKSLAGQVLDKM